MRGKIWRFHFHKIYMRLPCQSIPVAEAPARLKADAGRGLDNKEAQRRLERHGENSRAQTRTRSAGTVLGEQFKSMVIIVLWWLPLPACWPARIRSA